MRPERYADIQFDSRNISYADLVDFSGDHLARLAEYNGKVGGKFDELVAHTSDAYEALGGEASGLGLSKAIQKSKTATKALQLRRIKDALSRIAGTLHGKHRRDSPEYIAYFPQGLSELHWARQSEVQPILDRLVEVAQLNDGALYIELKALRDDWKVIYTDATRGKAATSSATDSRIEARESLARQLTRNVLTLALEFLGEPEKMRSFFDTSKIGLRLQPTDKKGEVAEAVETAAEESATRNPETNPAVTAAGAPRTGLPA